MRLLLLILFLSLLSCKPDRPKEHWEHFIIKADCEEVKKNPFVEKEKIQRDIPDFFVDPDNADMRCIEELLGICTLRNGYDSLEIRLWDTDSAFSFNDRLIRIRNTKGAYDAELYHLKIIIKEFRKASEPDLISYPIDSILVSTRKLGAPQLGWKSFMQQLERMGIYGLPDYEQVNGYGASDTDGGWQWVEYATERKYRHYNYPAPGKYEPRVTERKQFEKMVLFIEEQFAVH